MLQSTSSKEQALCTCTLEDACSLSSHLRTQSEVPISGVIFKYKAHDVVKCAQTHFCPSHQSMK